ncbi:MAG: hypothetical protein ACT4PL_12640, partial [Phycisphaerales bacterium]
MNPRTILALIALAGLATNSAADVPQFITIPNNITDLSNGGTVVVGSAGEATFRFVRSGGTATLTMLPGMLGGRPHCSADGSVVASDGFNGENASNGLLPEFIVGARWTAATGAQTYGTFTTPMPAVGIGSGGVQNTQFEFIEDGKLSTGLAYVREGSGINHYRAYRA